MIPLPLSPPHRHARRRRRARCRLGRCPDRTERRCDASWSSLHLEINNYVIGRRGRVIIINKTWNVPVLVRARSVKGARPWARARFLSWLCSCTCAFVVRVSCFVRFVRCLGFAFGLLSMQCQLRVVCVACVLPAKYLQLRLLVHRFSGCISSASTERWLL